MKRAGVTGSMMNWKSGDVCLRAFSVAYGRFKVYNRGASSRRKTGKIRRPQVREEGEQI